MVNGSGKVAGKELRKDYREVVNELVTNQGWRYEAGKGHSRLYPPTPTVPFVTISHTPTRNPRAFLNFVALVRRLGGNWPPERR